jgi:hypothetical protein
VKDSAFLPVGIAWRIEMFYLAIFAPNSVRVSISTPNLAAAFVETAIGGLFKRFVNLGGKLGNIVAGSSGSLF